MPLFVVCTTNTWRMVVVHNFGASVHQLPTATRLDAIAFCKQVHAVILPLLAYRHRFHHTYVHVCQLRK